MAPSLPPALVALAHPKDVLAGTLLFLQDEAADRCYFLEVGEVALRRIGRGGDEIEVARIEPGEWFGEAVMFAGQGFPVQATVVKASRVWEFRRRALGGALDPGVSGFFLGLLAQKCLGLNRRIQELTVMDARERVARYLLRLCPGGGCGGTGCRLSLPKKKVEIARELAMAPETLSRTLGQLEKDGFLVLTGTQVAVASCGRLRALAEAE